MSDIVRFITENAVTAAVLAVLVILVAVVVTVMVKKKKSGKRSCGTSCSDCPMRNKCK